MQNLPSEPSHVLVDDCLSLLKRIGIIDTKAENELTAAGRNAAKFFAVSPIFALATSEFTYNVQFGFLCSLIIENVRSIVTNPSTKFLYRHFNKDSDVVTLLDAIYEVSEGDISDYEGMGLSIGVIYSIYSQIENAFGVNDGCQAVVDAIKWSREQEGGTFGAVDRFINHLHREEFLNKRKCTFARVVNASPQRQPTLIYRANDVFKNDKSDEKLPANIMFSSRPGWIGLQSPGNIIALFVFVEEAIINCTIIHTDTNSDANAISHGVESLQVDNPCLGSFVFVSLFEGYMRDSPVANDLISFYSVHLNMHITMEENLIQNSSIQM